MKRLANQLKLFLTTLVVSSALLLTGCGDDSSPTGVDSSSDTVISGKVTDNQSAAKAGDVEGSDVRATEVNDAGGTSPSEGRATTDAQGRYTLETSANSAVMIVTATKGDFETKTLVAKRASTNSNAVAAMEMNAETRAEADVYVDAKRQDSDAEAVTAADVALYVDARTAADIDSRITSSAQVASAIRAAIQAESRYIANNQAASETQMRTSSDNKMEAFLKLQSNLSAGASSDVAMSTFVSAMADAHTDAGIDASASAQARQTAVLVIENLSSGLSAQARFALRQHAELLAASTTSAAIKSEFTAQSGMSAQASAVANAGATLRAAILSAQSESDIDAAWASFESETKAQLTAGLSIGATILSTIETNLASARTDFESRLSSATSVNAVVQARSNYNASMKTEAESQMSSSANAEFAARVYTLVSAR